MRPEGNRSSTSGAPQENTIFPVVVDLPIAEGISEVVRIPLSLVNGPWGSVVVEGVMAIAWTVSCGGIWLRWSEAVDMMTSGGLGRTIRMRAAL